MRGVPIGSYRDKMGALDGRNMQAYFCHQVLPIELLSDPLLFTLRVLRALRGKSFLCVLRVSSE